MSKKSKRKIFKGEIVWYSILGVIWVFGFVLSILGVCAFNIGKLSTNSIYQFQKTIGAFINIPSLDFRLVGSLFMIVTMIGFLIVVYYYSTKANQLEAKERRKQERMRILMEDENPENIEDKTEEIESLNNASEVNESTNNDIEPKKA